MSDYLEEYFQVFIFLELAPCAKLNRIGIGSEGGGFGLRNVRCGKNFACGSFQENKDVIFCFKYFKNKGKKFILKNKMLKKNKKFLKACKNYEHNFWVKSLKFD